MNCLSNLSRCGAYCCKSFVINSVGDVPHLERGGYYTVKLDSMTADKRAYYQLHNCVVEGETISFFLEDFKILDLKKILIEKRCMFLKDDLTCRGYPNNRPDICKEMDENCDTSKFYIPKNCLIQIKH